MVHLPSPYTSSHWMTVAHPLCSLCHFRQAALCVRGGPRQETLALPLP